MGTALVVTGVIVIIGALVLVTMQVRGRYQEINEPPDDMRRAGEDTRPPFDGRGGAV